ncbi:hypothetical protein EDD15DRAFT_2196410 [Pisolithus albus]|nr:hypothetical protein EDD15DRAFT_2196410 [Pisolithus albus]
MKILTFMNVGNEVIGISFPCAKVPSGTCGDGKVGLNAVLVGDEETTGAGKGRVKRQVVPLGAMSSTPGTRIINVVDDVIYVEVAGSLSKWETHTFTVDVQSPGIKKVVLRLKNVVNNVSLPAEEVHTLEQEALEQVEEASSKLEAAHAALWKAYEGTIGIQDTFVWVTDASARLGVIRNKLSLLKDSKAPPKTELGENEDANIKPNPASEDLSLQFQSTSASPCRVLPHYVGNPNPDPESSEKPWAYYVIPFDPIDIPTQRAKRKRLVDASTGPIPKHMRMEA